MEKKPPNKLEEFALFVLQVMEGAERHWGLDTLERISARAEKLGLARRDVDGFFEAVLPK